MSEIDVDVDADANAEVEEGFDSNFAKKSDRLRPIVLVQESFTS